MELEVAPHPVQKALGQQRPPAIPLSGDPRGAPPRPVLLHIIVLLRSLGAEALDGDSVDSFYKTTKEILHFFLSFVFALWSEIDGKEWEIEGIPAFRTRL